MSITRKQSRVALALSSSVYVTTSNSDSHTLTSCSTNCSSSSSSGEFCSAHSSCQLSDGASTTDQTSAMELTSKMGQTEDQLLVDQLIFEASCENHLEGVAELMSTDELRSSSSWSSDSIYYDPILQRSALQQAAWCGFDELCLVLLSKNGENCETAILAELQLAAKSRAPHDRGMTALQLATVQGHFNVVQSITQFCIKVGLDLAAVLAVQCDNGANVVHIAAMFSQDRIVRYFLNDMSPFIDVHIPVAFSGAQLVHFLCANRHSAFVERLVQDYGVDLARATDKNGRNVLHYMVTANDDQYLAKRVCNFVLRRQPELLKMRDNDNRTALDLARHLHNADMVEFLAKKMALSLTGAMFSASSTTDASPGYVSTPPRDDECEFPAKMLQFSPFKNQKKNYVDMVLALDED